MAIWPFGRKNKRHTIDLGSLETQGGFHPSDPALESKLGRKPSRKRSKRQKNRHLPPNEELPESISHPAAATTPYSNNERTQDPSLQNPRRLNTDPNNYRNPHRTSYPSTGSDQLAFPRAASLFKGKQGDTGPGLLRRKMSKRKANDIAREHEIRLLASAPIDIPHRHGDHSSMDTGRGRKSSSRRTDRFRSDTSLSARDSAGSSCSDISETYTFKVNAFAVWTPRPAVHYVEPPRTPAERSRNPSTASVGREKATVSDETSHANNRVENLADDLDAGALRELLERDRRRKERKRVERQKERDRRLKRRAERDQEACLPAEQGARDEHGNIIGVPCGRASQSDSAENDGYRNNAPKAPETRSGTWPQDSSSGSEERTLECPESMHAVGNTDSYSSVQVPKLATRPSLALSQDTGMSFTTTSPSQSIRQKFGSANGSQFSFAPGSMSDISRTVESERRLSDQSSRRMNSLSSFIRRGSSRLKRSYRAQARDQQSDFSNTSSHESFFKVYTQSSPEPLPQAPQKLFLGTGTIKRSQSKFKEHFGDEPLSPPDSRLQSPEIPETIPDVSAPADEEHSTMDVDPMSLDTPISEAEPCDLETHQHRSWDDESLETWDDNNIPLSQSLASVDSEGSWMSGQFLRRISQRRLNSVRQSIGSAGHDTLEEEEDGQDATSKGARHAPNSDERRVSFAESGRASSHALGDGSVNYDEDSEGRSLAGDGETWHDEIGRRPVVVSPTTRPKSTQVLLLKSVRELTPIFPEEEIEVDAMEEPSSEVDPAGGINGEQGQSDNPESCQSK
ncbi:hypothetical protein MPDQ_006147 [Monascus purpureus]|uniref:Uncharacterized protein n=1 Tax=Monascus purpureus TaxID=5098 RepID=A0A507R616_MONPU|nr:hypothetical protein MPDQ_006147 [Monascus purpureus]BDD62747.1 hypothetical protein MAP00_007708 [Monascus purpureus]